MANWTPWLFGVALAEMLVTTAGVWLVYRTLLHTRRAATAAENAVREAQRATHLTRQIGEAEVRAYLHVKRIKVSFLQGISRPYFTVVVVNTGQSPAHNVCCGVQVRLKTGDADLLGILPLGWRDELGKSVPAAGAEQSLYVDAGELPLTAKQIERSKQQDFGAFMSARVLFSYRDVFNAPWEDDAYFVGYLKRNPEHQDGFFGSIFGDAWLADLSPVARPQNWGRDGPLTELKPEV